MSANTKGLTAKIGGVKCSLLCLGLEMETADNNTLDAATGGLNALLAHHIR